MLEQVLEALPKHIARIVLQNGLSLSPAANPHEWMTHAGVAKGEVVLPLATFDGFSLKPLLVDVQLTGGISWSVILRPSDGKVQPRPNPSTLPQGAFFAKALTIDYLLEALAYHVASLTRHYQRVCDRQKEATQLVDFGDALDVTYSGNPEPYYEFDAILGVARRSYEALSETLSQVFGPIRGVGPRDFPEVVRGASALDGSFRARLLASWTDIGVPVKDYRDCIHHFTPVGRALSPMHMHQVHPGVWTAAAYIPDNPEVKSTPHFTFERRVDALDFAWLLANELHVIAGIVLHEARRVSA